MNSNAQVSTYGMSSVERILITALGTILFALMAWALVSIIDNSSRIAVLQQRVTNHDVVLDRLYVDMREHRMMTEKP